MAAPVVHLEILGRSGARLRLCHRKRFDQRIDSGDPMKHGVVEKAERGIGRHSRRPGEGAVTGGRRLRAVLRATVLPAHLGAVPLAGCLAGAPAAFPTVAGDSTGILFTISGLTGPEAVRYDPGQDVYFIANFGEPAGDPRDANGFISRVSASDGTMEARRYMTGTTDAPLHMPRGMFILRDTLWVADVDGVHGFLPRTGRQAAFIDMSAHEPGFLNDVAAGPDGALYITDTGRGRVYRIGADRRARIAIEDERTGPPNGITWDGERAAFLLAPWGSETMLRAWDPVTSELRDVQRLDGGRFDGIELVEGRVLIASQVDSTVHVIDGGRSRPLLRVPGRPADIGVDTRRGRVAVPYVALNRVDVWALRPE